MFFPWEKHVHAGPNGRQFIVRPTLHELCDKINSNYSNYYQTIATDECDVTITTNKHGSMTLNRVVQMRMVTRYPWVRRLEIQRNLPM